MRFLYSCICLSFLSISCTKSDQNDYSYESNSITNIPYQILGTIPHDTNSFIEGLEFYKGTLYESSAYLKDLPNTTSSIGVVNSSSGEIDKKIVLDKNLYFSEGITILNDRIYHVTYKNRKGFIYELSSYKKIKEFNYDNEEGWGLTNDGTHIIMSDGSHNLTFFDPNLLNVIKRLSVTENGLIKDQLNELEFINGYIYANVWTKDQIVKIDTFSGYVVGVIDCSNLKIDATNKFPRALETNGIAFDPSDSTILITGKIWPTYYKIKIPSL